MVTCCKYCPEKRGSLQKEEKGPKEEEEAEGARDEQPVGVST